MHHHHRKSGHTSGYTSMTDMRKAVTASDFSTYKKHSSRPATMSRRITPQSGSALKLGKSPRDREKELEDRWWDDEREAFPQYCMYCETQFLPSPDDQSLSLYCSDRCRYDDECSPSQLSTVFPSRSQTQQSYSAPDPLRDIIPRAAPSGGHFSPPTTPHTTAIASLKSHLPNRPTSPPSPAGTFNSHHWLGRSTQTSPGSSYAKATNYFPSTYDGVYYGVDHYGSSTDRPLSTRRPGVYSRPKSIELVTPMLGGR